MWWKTTVHKKETKWFAKTRMLGADNKNYIKARYCGRVYERDKTCRNWAETLDKTCQRRDILRPSGLGVLAAVILSYLDTTYTQQNTSH